MKIRLLLASLASIFIMSAPLPAFAATDIFDNVCNNKDASGGQLTNGNGSQADSVVCKSKTNSNPLYGPDGVLTTAVSILSIAVGVVAVVMIILGGLKFVTSGSNPQDVTKARETIIYAVAGVVIAILAQLVVQFVLKSIK